MTDRNRRPFRVGRPFDGFEPLEERQLAAVTNLTASASPVILRQINPMNQPHAVQVAVIRPVTLSGYVTETTGGVIPAVSFHVIDQKGRDMPSGPLTPQFAKTNAAVPPNLFFFTRRFGLNRTPVPGDLHQRHYTVVVTAQDAQNSLTIDIPVTTPPRGR
jgi:hypothetical protein